MAQCTTEHAEGVVFSTTVVQPQPHTHEHTNSVNRSYSDLDQRTFLLYAFGLCALRTAVQQPLNLALARKQTCSAANAQTTLQVLRRICQHEGGWRGLTQGMAALTLGCAVSEVAYLGLFEYGRERLPLGSELSRDAAAGYLADAACRVLHIPLSIIAFRQMTHSNNSAAVHRSWHRGQRHGGRPTALATLRRMYGERGMRSVYAGYGSTLLVGCQWTALWWGLYGAIKSSCYAAAAPLLIDDEGAPSPHVSPAVPRWLLAKDDNMAINSIASVVTSAATAVLFNPYLVIRTNLQVTPNATLCAVTRQLWRTRGFSGFYSGLALNIGACIVEGALASTSYEYAKLWSDVTRHHTTAAAPLSLHDDAPEVTSVESTLLL